MSQKLHRRTILQCIAAVAASTAFGCSDEETSRLEGHDFFPQSLASGDPRPDSVVLWTRAVDPEFPNQDTPLTLQVSTQESFGTLVLERKDLKALAEFDHAIKVKVTNLSPRTTYYYRFSYEKDGQTYTTAVGRTRTAPAPGDDVPVKFAFASCQDYIGRYYNTWLRLLHLDEDLDFVVFLGDYIYETTGDASFQSSTGGGRTVQFSEPEGAITQKTGFLEYYAAASLSNYRDIYKTVRGDRVLQRVHERYPFITVWDDHEFSDDSWGSNASYEDGKKNEKQDERKQNAERAFFEYTPLDHEGTTEGAIDVSKLALYPNTRIYRDFDFGKNLKLVVTDMRTFRPDHLIPEDAYPGKVVLTQETLTAGLGGVPPAFQSDAFAYVDIDDPAYAQQKGTLQAVYQQLAVRAGVSDADAAAKAAAYVTGPQALLYINQVLAQVNSALVIPPTEDMPKGVAYAHMGKQGLFDMRGSRYIVVKDTFDLYSMLTYAASGGTSESMLGAEQQAWLMETLAKATNSFKVVVSSVSLTSMVWDLRDKTDIPDATLRQRFYFNADQWDGFPSGKNAFIAALKSVSNPLIISGDIHASFVSVETAADPRTGDVINSVPALTTPAISSGSIQELAGTAVRAAGYTPESAVYRHAVANMAETMKAAHPGLVFTNADNHGFVVMEVRGNEALASFHLISSQEVAYDYSLRSPEVLASKFTRLDFRVRDGAITQL